MARTVLRWTNGDAITAVDFDAVESEAPSHEVSISEYPIELGASWSTSCDRARNVRLTALLSNARHARASATWTACSCARYAVRVRCPSSTCHECEPSDQPRRRSAHPG